MVPKPELFPSTKILRFRCTCEEAMHVTFDYEFKSLYIRVSSFQKLHNLQKDSVLIRKKRTVLQLDNLQKTKRWKNMI